MADFVGFFLLWFDEKGESSFFGVNKQGEVVRIGKYRRIGRKEK